MKRYFCTFFFLAFCLCLTAQNKESLQVSLVPSNDGFFPNRVLQLHAEVLNKNSVDQEFTINWQITNDEGVVLREKEFPYKVKGDSVVWAYCPIYRFQSDGFFEVRAIVQTAETSQKIKTVVTVNPEKITSPLRKTDDFDAFWSNAKDELSQVNPEYKVKKIKRDKSAKTHLYEVEMKSIGGLTVRGWLEVPKKKGVYPTLLQVPGYTVNLEPVDKYDDMVIFSFNVRDHGNSDNTGERNYKMWARGLDNPKAFYYYGIYLDCLRAMDFLMTREEVDQSKIAVWGASQGGGLAWVTASLDQRVSLCIADIPFLTDWERYFSISNWEEIDEWMAHHPNVSWDEILTTLSYFDTKNMVDKIQCPVYMGIGMQDEVCPPATSFAAYNRITTPKKYFIDQDQGHWVSDERWEEHYQEVRSFFKMDKENK